MLNDKPLRILSASAGSGKTFSIVITYLELVIKDKARFNSVLAMTFTKAASLEMRNRIIEALHNLSLGEDVGYMQTVATILTLDPEEISKSAKKVLTEILHNYEDFQISTLDKFNLRLVKTFSRELDLDNNFETVVDASEILEEAIDNLISKVNEPGNEQLTELMIGYANAFSEGEKKWRIKGDLIAISKDFKGENNAAMIEVLIAQPAVPIAVYWEMRSKKLQLEADVNHMWSDFLDKNDENFDGLNKAFLNAIHAFFKKKQRVNSKSLQNNIEKAYQPSAKSKIQIDPEFLRLLERKIAQVRDYFKKMDDISFKLNCFFPLECLKLIAIELKVILMDRNLFLLADTSLLISQLIQEEETPFIYEKLGNRFSHFLLDEFQDTSRKQWNNLFPLVFDALSREGKPQELQKSMIVGDAKQSIYRFRGGVSAQFVALPSLYNPEGNAKIADRSRRFSVLGEKNPLDFNFRSLQNIVHFNNEFFTGMKSVLDPEYLEYYEDVKQIAKKDEGGFVQFIEIEYDKEALDLITNYAFADVEDDEDTERDEEAVASTSIVFDLVYAEVKTILTQALNSGFSYGDVCILSRTKAPLTMTADALSKEDINVVSVDSLMVKSSPGVQLIVNFLKFQNDPFSNQIAFDVNQSLERMTGKTVNSWLETTLFSEQTIFTAKELQEFMQNPMFHINFDNLYDAGMQAIRLFGLQNQIDYFLQHLLDMLHRFDLQWNNDLASFIEFWNTKGCQESVLLPTSDNAVQIMTVHKSKGLEFPIVILLDKLWMTVKRRNDNYFLMDDNDVIYSRLSKNSPSELITDKFELEEKELQLDHVNLMYVACTRATQRLYMIDCVKKKKEKEDEEDKLGVRQLSRIAMETTGMPVFEQEENRQCAKILKFHMGTEAAKIIEKSKKTNQLQSMKLDKSGRMIWFPSISYENREKLEANVLSEERIYGNTLHLILSTLPQAMSLKDVNEVVKKAIKNGELNNKFETQIVNDLNRISTFEPYQKLIDKSIKIMNEQTLIKSNGTLLRPDKILQINDLSWVVIDYKTGAQEPKHKAQVHEYKAVLSQILGENVIIEGILFYTTQLDWVEV